MHWRKQTLNQKGILSLVDGRKTSIFIQIPNSCTHQIEQINWMNIGNICCHTNISSYATKSFTWTIMGLVTLIHQFFQWKSKQLNNMAACSKIFRSSQSTAPNNQRWRFDTPPQKCSPFQCWQQIFNSAWRRELILQHWKYSDFLITLFVKKIRFQISEAKTIPTQID